MESEVVIHARNLYSALVRQCMQTRLFALFTRRFGRYRTKVMASLGGLCAIVFLVCVAIPPLIYDKNPNAYAIPVEIGDLTRGRNIYRTDNNSQLAPSGPLLTLFTTFKDIPLRRTVNENTLRYWSKLQPYLQLVLYVESDTSDTLVQLARSQGWLVYQSPRLRKGYPVLKDMFLHTIHNVTPHTQFVGYANSDILFTRDLLETLGFVKWLGEDFLKQKGLLMSGRRITVFVDDIKFEKNGRFIDYTVMGKVDAQYDSSDAIDYFITTRDGYPWQLVPDFVIGKPGYDNWLLMKAVEWDLFSLDTSLTVTALHQVLSTDNRDKGWLSKDVCINRDLVDLGAEFPYYKGDTMCLRYFTQASVGTFYSDAGTAQTHSNDFQGGDVVLFQRNALTYTCHGPPSITDMLMRQFSSKKGFCKALVKRKNKMTEKYVQMMRRSQ